MIRSQLNCYFYSYIYTDVQSGKENNFDWLIDWLIKPYEYVCNQEPTHGTYFKQPDTYESA